MRTVVYYDLETVSSEDVERTTSLAGADAIHVHLADAVWPADCRVETATLTSSRDYGFRSNLMQFFDRLRNHLPTVELEGIDLLEVVRYEWLFGFEKYFHRVWALSALMRDYQPAKIVLIVSHATNVGELRDWCSLQNVRLEVVDRAAGSTLAISRRVARATRLFAYQSRESLKRLFRQTRQPPSERAKGSRIVVAEFYPNSVSVSVSVAEQLRQMSDAECLFVAGRDAAARAFSRAGIEPFYIDQFSSQQSASFATLKSTFTRAIEKMDSQNFVVAPDCPACRDYLLPELLASGVAHLHVAATCVKHTIAMLKALRPQTVVTTTTASAFGRAIGLTAQSMSIPAVYLQHGLLGEGTFFSHFPFDRILVWGDCNRRALVAAGVAAEQVAVVGAPTHDALVQWKQAASEKAMAQVDVAPRVVFLASRAGGSIVSEPVFERILRDVIASALAIPDATLVVKPHPNDHSGLAERIGGGAHRVAVVTDQPSLKLISECDVAIVTSSTTGLEACALGKPLVLYNPTGGSDLPDYARYRAAISVRDAKELAETLCRILCNGIAVNPVFEGQRKLVDDMLDGATGQASQKAANVLCELIKASRTDRAVE